MAHEDGVAAVGRLWHKGEATALVAQLVTLGTHVNEHDSCDKSHIAVGKQISHSPCRELQDTSYPAKPLYAKPGNVFADAARCRRTSQSAKSQHTHRVTSRMERCACQMESHTRPYCHHAAETQPSTQGIDADGRVSAVNASYRPHQLAVAALKTVGHDG